MTRAATMRFIAALVEPIFTLLTGKKILTNRMSCDMSISSRPCVTIRTLRDSRNKTIMQHKEIFTNITAQTLITIAILHTILYNVLFHTIKTATCFKDNFLSLGGSHSPKRLTFYNFMTAIRIFQTTNKALWRNNDRVIISIVRRAYTFHRTQAPICKLANTSPAITLFNLCRRFLTFAAGKTLLLSLYEYFATRSNFASVINCTLKSDNLLSSSRLTNSNKSLYVGSHVLPHRSLK